MIEFDTKMPNATLNWNKSGTNKQIINELKERILYSVDENSQLDFEKILKYDFDSNTDGSENAVIRLFNAMIKTPNGSIFLFIAVNAPDIAKAIVPIISKR